LTAMAMMFWRAAGSGGSPVVDDTSALVMQAGGADAAATAAIAAESRRAVCGVAECLVKIKAIESAAAMEVKRLEEYGATERCRISEEHKSGRCHRQARVAELAVSEDAKTKRLEIGAWQKVASEAIAANARIEEVRAKASRLFSWIFGGESGAVVGPAITGAVVGATFFAGPSRRRGEAPTRAAMARKIAIVALMISVPAWFIRRLLRRCGEDLVAARDMWLGAVLSIVTKGLGLERSWDATKLPLPKEKRSSSGGVSVSAGVADERGDAARSCALRPALPLAAEAIPSESLGEAAAALGVAALRDSLEAWGLEQYAGALSEQGYDDGQMLLSLTAAERDAMLGAIGCKPGHRVRFQRMLDGLAPPPASGSPSPTSGG